MSPYAFVTGVPVTGATRALGANSSAAPRRRAAASPPRPASWGATRRSAPAAAGNGARMMAGDDANKAKGGNNPLGGLGGLGNIMDAFKKAQEFTSVAKDLQEQLRNTEIEASVRDGAVKVTMNAQQVPIKVEVSDQLVAQGSAEVSAAVTEGVIAAHTKSSEYMKEKMGSLTKEFGIPQPPTQ